MNARLAGKVALVSGGSRGIGLGIARRLLADGAAVAIGARSQANLSAAVKGLATLGEEAQGRLRAFRCDVTREEEVRETVAACSEQLGALDIMVASAGIAGGGRLLDASTQGWTEVLDVNLLACMRQLRASAATMVAQGRGGRLIVVTSTNAFWPEPGLGAYNPSKAGAWAIARTAALELAEHQITVNCVAPGLVETDMTERLLADPEAAREYLHQIPLRRFGRAEDVAGAVSFLASEEAGWITGHQLVIDGGQTAGASVAPFRRPEQGNVG